MLLKLENIGIFVDKTIELPDKNRVFKIVEPSSTGKTTIARVIDAFVRGEITLDLLRFGATHGKAELVFQGQKYMLSIRRDSASVSRRIIDKPWNRYLVFTEFSELYPLYKSPNRDLKRLVQQFETEFFPEDPRLRRLKEQLQRLDSEASSYFMQAKQYEEKIRQLEAMQRKLIEEIKEIESAAKNIVTLDITPVIQFMSLSDKLKSLKQQLEEIRKELSNLAIEKTKYDVQSAMSERERLLDEKRYLEEREKRLSLLASALKEAYEGVKRLKDVEDILVEEEVILFGKILTPDVIDSVLRDFSGAISDINSKLNELHGKIKEIRSRLMEVESTIEKYNAIVAKESQLKREMWSISREITNIEGRLSQLKIEIEKLMQKTGAKTVEELLRIQEEREKILKLLARKRELEEKLRSITREKGDYEGKLKLLKQKLREIEEKNAEIAELQRQITELERQYTRKRHEFSRVFEKSMKEFLAQLRIPDFDVENLKLLRSPITYSQTERFMIATAVQWALLKGLEAAGEHVPIVVVDVIAPIDQRHERYLIDRYKELRADKVLLLFTGSEARVTIIE